MAAPVQQMSPPLLVDLLPDRKHCVYTSCYCEENVWKLCDYVRTSNPSHLRNCYAVFISNDDRMIPLWFQKSASSLDGAVCWDYHVIFIAGTNEMTSRVYDLDTALPFPCKFLEYYTKAVRPNKFLQKQFHRSFRVVPAEVFLEHFASDRSHMLNEDKTWKSDPPPYPCIQTLESMNNIQDFISMESSQGWGQVLDDEEFVVMFQKCL
ncbi:hypothetical protein ScPMuIL_006099 [Solemya velum]